MKYIIKHSEHDYMFFKHKPRSELYLIQKYNLDINEVLANLNKSHYYKSCFLLKQPLTISRIEE